jgi:benzodiazapine receptor
MMLNRQKNQIPQTNFLTALGFAIGVFSISMAIGFLAFSFLPTEIFTAQNVPAIEPIAWLFWAVWIVIYPSIGVATYLIWKRRTIEDVALPLLLFCVLLLQNLSFWLSNTVRMTTVIDATGLFLSYTLAYSYYRHSKAAALWLLPLLIWMPITLTIKIWLWTSQGG